MQEGRQLWVWLDGAFVLKIPNFEVEAFDLAVELDGVSMRRQVNEATQFDSTKSAAFSLRATFSF